MHATSDPVVICVAPNGARRNRADHPAIPVQAAEIAADALRCAVAGATVIHLHVRDSEGKHSLDPQRYREAMTAVEEAVGDRLLIQITSEAAGIYEPEQQSRSVLAVRPKAASVSVREMMRDPVVARGFYAAAAAADIALQHILYSGEDVVALLSLIERGDIDEGANALFVLGRYSEGMRGCPTDLLGFVERWPAGWPWSVCAFGATEPQCVAAAIGLGGHVRVGFENNLADNTGAPASENAANVANAVALARSAGRGIADLRAARAFYGVSAREAGDHRQETVGK